MTETIVLPGAGTPVTFTPREDSIVGVFIGGKIVHLKLKGGVTTRVEFLNSVSRSIPSVA